MAEASGTTGTGTRKRLGQLLLDSGIIKPEDLPAGLAEAQKQSLRIGEMLVMMRFMSAEVLSAGLQAQSLLDAGNIDERTAVCALKLCANEGLSFDDAMDRHREMEADSLENKERQLEETMVEISHVTKIKGNTHRDLADLNLKAASLQMLLGQNSEAEKSIIKAIHISENSFGKSNLKVCPALSKLLDLQISQKRYGEAEPLSWRIIQIIQEGKGPDSLEAAEAFLKMGRVMSGNNRFVEAEQFYLSALRIKEKVLGPDHPELIDHLRQMAAFWSKQGKKAERKRIGELLVESGLLKPETLQDAIQKAQKQSVPLGQYLLTLDSLKPAVVRAGLQAQLLIGDGIVPSQLACKALRLCAKKDIPFDEALDELGWEPDSLSTTELSNLLSTADELVTAEMQLGPNHIGVAVICNRLADDYRRKGRLQEAEAHYRRSLGILEKFFGPKDPEVSHCLYKLGCLFREQSRMADAEPLQWRALEIRQKSLGQNHEDVAESLQELALIKAAEGNDQQAEVFLRSALAIKEQVFGKESEKVIDVLEATADLLSAGDKGDQAEPLYKKLIRIIQRDPKQNPQHLARILDKLARLYMQRNELSSAETQLELSLEILERSEGKESVALLDTLDLYAELMKMKGKNKESEDLAKRANLLRKKGERS